MTRCWRPLTRALPRAALLAVSALALTALGADCDGNVVQDPTFRDWCGDTLCKWHVDSGRIQRVPTWNADDFGVSFVDEGTQITQQTQEDQATCLLFKTVVNIDPAAQMTLLVDFDNDGIIDFRAPLGAADWHKIETEISAPPAYRGITFHLRKEGPGTAVLAEMQVLSTTGCPPAAAIPLPPQPFGQACAKNADCLAGLVCASGSCSQCGDDTECPDGASCSARVVGARLCGPGRSLGKTGDPCALDDDCASNDCVGAAVSSLATVFGDTDAGCTTAAPQCDLDAAPDSAAAACECILTHNGTCR